MGVHDSQKGRLLAEAAVTEADLLRALPGTTGAERDAILAQLATVDVSRSTADSLSDNTYWCHFSQESFVSAERMIFGMSYIIDHDADGIPTKHDLRGFILVMCPTCKATILPVEAAKTEHD